jgi:hypothetical protein
MNPLDQQLEHSEVMPLEPSGQKRMAAELENQVRLKKPKHDNEDEEDIQVSQTPNGFPTGYDGSLIQSPSVREQMIEQRAPTTPMTGSVFTYRDGDPGYEYDISHSGRKTGRMAGAKGYSQQEIQALFSFIREKVFFLFFPLLSSFLFIHLHFFSFFSFLFFSFLFFSFLFFSFLFFSFLFFSFLHFYLMSYI